eukprot:3896075-Ditylum_brightwellii.AAC.1
MRVGGKADHHQLLSELHTRVRVQFTKGKRGLPPSHSFLFRTTERLLQRRPVYQLLAWLELVALARLKTRRGTT